MSNLKKREKTWIKITALAVAAIFLSGLLAPVTADDSPAAAFSSVYVGTSDYSVHTTSVNVFSPPPTCSPSPTYSMSPISPMSTIYQPSFNFGSALTGLGAVAPSSNISNLGNLYSGIGLTGASALTGTGTIISPVYTNYYSNSFSLGGVGSLGSTAILPPSNNFTIGSSGFIDAPVEKSSNVQNMTGVFITDMTRTAGGSVGEIKTVSCDWTETAPADIKHTETFITDMGRTAPPISSTKELTLGTPDNRVDQRITEPFTSGTPFTKKEEKIEVYERSDDLSTVVERNSQVSYSSEINVQSEGHFSSQ